MKISGRRHVCGALNTQGRGVGHIGAADTLDLEEAKALLEQLRT
jgi:hypothetical protein